MRYRISIAYCVLFFLGTHLVYAQGVDATMGKVKLEFHLDANGAPTYSIYFGTINVILPSRMGFTFADANPMVGNFEVVGTEKKSVDQTWQPVLGEVKSIRDHYEQLTVHLREKSESKSRRDSR